MTKPNEEAREKLMEELARQLKGYLRSLRDSHGDDIFIRYQLGDCSKGYLCQEIAKYLVDLIYSPDCLKLLAPLYELDENKTEETLKRKWVEWYGEYPVAEFVENMKEMSQALNQSDIIQVKQSKKGVRK